MRIRQTAQEHVEDHLRSLSPDLDPRLLRALLDGDWIIIRAEHRSGDSHVSRFPYVSHALNSHNVHDI